MLIDGFHHVATLTKDSECLHAFYTGGLRCPGRGKPPRVRGCSAFDHPLSPMVELNVFQIEGNTQADHQVPMFGRGRIDHIGLRAPTIEAFEEVRRRLMDRRTANDFVTDFGPVLSVFFTDPDGLEGEVLVANPDGGEGVHNKPGTRSARYPVTPEAQPV
jgi:catechol 2,3-dioxygenase-like lactoylglutathione lyase family enzyme